MEVNMENIPNPINGHRPENSKKEQSLNYLLGVRDVVFNTVEELGNKYGAENPFSIRMVNLLDLGDRYIEYLKTHRENLDKKNFSSIVRMANNSFLFNIKLFKMTEGEMAQFREKNPGFHDLKYLSDKEEGSVWKNSKQVLYDPEYNDVREYFREGIIKKVQDNPATKNTFNCSSLDHLERFLPLGGTIENLNSLLQQYIQENQESIEGWASLPLADFQKYIAGLIPDESEDLPQLENLKKIEEELASIKLDHLKQATGKNIRYPDRAKKLKFIRDLRFGRIDLDNFKKEFSGKASLLDDMPTLQKTLGPLLRKNLGVFIETLKSTEAMPKEERVAIIAATINSFSDIRQEIKMEVLEFIKDKI